MRKAITHVSFLLFIITTLFSQSGCKYKTMSEDEFRQSVPEDSPFLPGSADNLIIVDCLLPPKIKKLGTRMIYLESRRPIKTTAHDCGIRGGEYAVDDRSVALKVWLDKAKEGDKVAQTYVGEIYEKGLGMVSDYVSAAKWYQKAAGQGYASAQINLGHLYEKGLGVQKDMLKALDLYRKASGLKDAIVLDPAGKDEQDALRQEIERWKHAEESLRKQLGKTMKQLEQTQQELEQRKDETETERLNLKKVLQELEEQKRQAASEINSLKEQLMQRNAKLEDQRDEIELLYQGKAGLDVKANELEQTRRRLERTQQELNQRIKEAETEREKFEQTRKELEETQLELKRKMEGAETERQNLEKTFHELKNQKEKAEKAGDYPEINRLEKQIKERDTELEHQRKEIERLYQEIAGLDIKANDLKQTRQQLKQTQQELDQRIKVAEIEREKFEQTRKELEETQQELKRKIEEAETERLELEKTSEELETQKKQAEDRAKSMEEKLIQSDILSQKREHEISQLNKEKARLDEKVKHLNEELDEQRNRLENIKLAPPTIIMIKPPLITRGVSDIKKVDAETEYEIVGRVTAPAGLKIFTVNAREEEPDEDGYFKAPIMVHNSNVHVRLVAVDEQGEQDNVEFQLTPEELPPPPPPKPVLPCKIFGNYHALIIGNKDYKYEGWPDLVTPKNDAEKIAEILEKKYGFNKPEVILNATRRKILDTLHIYRKDLTEKDNLLIYYAGHGYLEEKINQGYWIPVDGKESITDWISCTTINEILQLIDARHILVVADSCYSGKLTRTSIPDIEGVNGDDIGKKHWIEEMAARRSRSVLTSGDLHPVLDVGNGGHSLFAKYFLKILSENNYTIEVKRLHMEIQAPVFNDARKYGQTQNPQYQPLKLARHESGEFFFCPVKK